ncbi:MAG: hypothetical protein AB1758_12455 [Candidatus Eremiobacterota bacterium]
MQIQTLAPTSFAQTGRSASVAQSASGPVDRLGSSVQPSGTYTREMSPGQRQALQFVGIGVMFGGILASSALPSPWNAVGIIGSMCGGLAIMAAARG